MARNSLSSFLSEHSVEYVLVPNLVGQLATVFRAIPIFFWASREGNITAQRSFRDLPVRILSVFARRPKISASRPKSIFMKINVQLLEYAAKGAVAGIPTLAGIPLTASLQNFGLDCSCCWFRLNGLVGDTGDQIVEIPLDERTVAFRNASNSRLHGPLSDSQIQAIASSCSASTWKDAVDKVRSLRADTKTTGRYLYFGGYKPFHLILLPS
jgi:hypothetical protein